MKSLEDAVKHVRARIARSRASRINEQNTKASLIDPILRALEWDVEEWEEMQREFKVQSVDNPVDYALMDHETKTPLLFLEAKALGENLDDRRWAGQIMGYAHVAGVKWVVLSDGDEYRLYNAYAEGPVEDKIFRKFHVSDENSGPEVALALLTKSQVRKKQIEATWRAEYIDQKVRSALERLFYPDPDTSITNLIKRRVPELTPSDIKAGLARVQVRFEFPVSGHSGSEPSRPEPTPTLDRMVGREKRKEPDGGLARPSSLRPQQATLWSVFTPQAWLSPALTWRKRTPTLVGVAMGVMVGVLVGEGVLVGVLVGVDVFVGVLVGVGDGFLALCVRPSMTVAYPRMRLVLNFPVTPLAASSA